MDKEGFGKYFKSIYQNGCLMLSIGLGHDLGLFKVMCEAKKPISVEEVAECLKLKERYTKEWLSAMVAAGIILQNRETNLYTVPEEFRETIMTQMGFAPILFTLGKRSDKVKECFKKDGPYGISYQDEEASGWFDWFDGYRSLMCDNTVDNEYIPLLTQQGVVPKLESGIKVLDVGCGSGSYANVLAQRFPNSTFVGLDYSEVGVEKANRTKSKKGLTNITFTTGDAHNLPEEWTESFDFVFVYDVLHDLPNPHKALEQIYKVLKNDGYFSLIEIGFHSNPVDNAGDRSAAMYYACSSFICLPSSMTQEPRIGYGACWGREEIEKAIKQANFKISGKSSLIVIGTKAFFLCTK
ncbi:S-adenosylmethionine-dependent methyltransferase Rv2258c-like [Mercenaria mercenaria]|uniref:S-adenosylmethionine-dependent methyltransferase Rv2258c-like n=1 Tax=Mercenaria mercenaria TaxID=6596 RepID=UPI00234F5609|nr:S-adenosylmethionine-dependent methyltransferase Rv2258c-like [Mercenaria mercenaria]XP_053399494.1 S-adenosylmethionine-dependent methyltransferase Rv2258c-like [Mercenaria mercenaria]